MTSKKYWYILYLFLVFRALGWYMIRYLADSLLVSTRYYLG